MKVTVCIADMRRSVFELFSNAVHLKYHSKHENIYAAGSLLRKKDMIPTPK